MMDVSGSATGRWAHKSAALGAAYHMGALKHDMRTVNLASWKKFAANYARIEQDIYARMISEDKRKAGRRHWMKRAHDRNTNARLRHAQATLLGWQFVAQCIGEIVAKNDAGKLGKQTVLRWWAGHEQRAAQRLGPYTSRHRAVVAALKDMGIEA